MCNQIQGGHHWFLVPTETTEEGGVTIRHFSIQKLSWDEAIPSEGAATTELAISELFSEFVTGFGVSSSLTSQQREMIFYYRET